MHENIFNSTAANKHHSLDRCLLPWLVWFGWMKRNVRIAYQISNCNDIDQMLIQPIFFFSHLNEWREPYTNQCCSTFNIPNASFNKFICIFTLENFIYLLNFILFFCFIDCLQTSNWTKKMARLNQGHCHLLFDV